MATATKEQCLEVLLLSVWRMRQMNVLHITTTVNAIDERGNIICPAQRR